MLECSKSLALSTSTLTHGHINIILHDLNNLDILSTTLARGAQDSMVVVVCTSFSTKPKFATSYWVGKSSMTYSTSISLEFLFSQIILPSFTMRFMSTHTVCIVTSHVYAWCVHLCHFIHLVVRIPPHGCFGDRNDILQYMMIRP